MSDTKSVSTLFLGMFVFIALSGCNRSSEEKPPKQSVDLATAEESSEQTAVGPQNSADAATVSNKDLRQLGTVPEFTLTDQQGQSFGTRNLYGKVWVANFIFTRCGATCPAQTARLAELQKQLRNDGQWSNTRLVSISVDPEFDTPEVLAAYAAKAEADQKRWKFLTGSRDEIWKLSKEGFKLPVGREENPKMPIFHSPMMVVVDPYLRIRGFYDVMTDTGLSQLKRHLTAIQKARVPFPADVLDTPWIGERRESQLQAAQQLDVFHDFSYSDELDASQITFRHKIVDDSAINYKGVHYDHGNGVSIADVDNDGKLDIYFTTQAGANELWRNLGNGKFENITGDSGLDLKDRISVCGSFADIDNDGDSDLYVTTVRGGNSLFENDGAGKFKDISQTSGLDHQGHSAAAVFFDYDRDGLLDLFLTNVGKYTTDEVAVVQKQKFRGDTEDCEFYVGFDDAFSGHLKAERTERSILFRNKGNNQFEDVSEQTGLQDESWTGAATPIDRNQDGWPDLYVCNMQGHDEYYENMAGKRFEKKSREIFPRTSWGAMSIKSFDFDNDGDMDIFITDMHSDMSEHVAPVFEKDKSIMQWPESFTLSDDKQSIWGNSFFRNNGDGTYEEVSDEINAENYWPWGLSVGDLNADGFQDAFVASSMNYPLRYGINSLYLNQRGGKFVDSEFTLGIEPRRPDRMAAPWFELDISGAGRDHSIAEIASGKVVVWSATGTRSTVIFDLDDDGDLDIVTNEFNTPPMVLVSNLTEQKPDVKFVKIGLVGSESNRDGLGAVVTVHSESGTYTQVNDGQSGYLAQSVAPLYFGLADDPKLKKIEITWPSGTKQTLPGPIDINKLIVIEEKADE